MSKNCARGKFFAEMMHERFVRKSVKSVAPNSGVKISLRNRKMRRNFGHCLMECVVETCELCCVRKVVLRGLNQRERLWNMQRRKMYCRAQFVQKFRSDQLMRDEIRSAMHDSMTYRNRRVMNVLLNFFRKSCQRVALRFGSIFACDQRLPIPR